MPGGGGGMLKFRIDRHNRGAGTCIGSGITKGFIVPVVSKYLHPPLQGRSMLTVKLCFLTGDLAGASFALYVCRMQLL